MSLALPTANVVVPPTTIVPESVIAPPVVTDRFPEIVIAPRSKAPDSTKVKLAAEVMTKDPKLLLLFSVISLAPAANVALPTTNISWSVIAPAVVTLVRRKWSTRRYPAPTSLSITLLPLVIIPSEKLLALSR